ncbi:MAG: FtsB family cell division protein [Chitinophagaceae bacterium]
MNINSHIPAWLKNKYFLTTVAFLAWIVFFDDRDLINNMARHRELRQLEDSRDHYIKEVNTISLELEQLKNDASVLEKYAREKYRMKKDNEDLFIVPE